jgi:hypothetical protein
MPAPGKTGPKASTVNAQLLAELGKIGPMPVGGGAVMSPARPKAIPSPLK